jgi:hypothetical protein
VRSALLPSAVLQLSPELARVMLLGSISRHDRGSNKYVRAGYECYCGFKSTRATGFLKHIKENAGAGEIHRLIEADAVLPLYAAFFFPCLCGILTRSVLWKITVLLKLTAVDQSQLLHTK